MSDEFTCYMTIIAVQCSQLLVIDCYLWTAAHYNFLRNISCSLFWSI